MSRTQRDYWLRKARFEICVLGGSVEKVELANSSIQGYWTSCERFKAVSPSLVEDFLNTRADAAGILRFTKQHGPLYCSVRDAVTDPLTNDSIVPERSFWKIGIDEWIGLQGILQDLWKKIGKSKVQAVSSVVEDGEELQCVSGYGLVRFQAATLYRFIWYSLMSMPAERMKKCARTAAEGCPTPYFFAQHLRQEYCSGVCARWAKTKWKREWWNRRKEQTKGGKN